MTGALAHCLIDAFNAAGVEYCHWKSNVSLDDGLSGDLDVDLLVGRTSLAPALRILADFGFKPATVGSGPKDPGVSHHYGLDEGTGRLVHVHLFSRLVTGESLVKSHVFPFDAMLLENGSRIGSVRVPSRAAELLLHVVRTFVKYGSAWDLVRIGRKPDDVDRETRWLLEGTEIDDVVALARVYCPVIEAPLLRRGLAELQRRAALLPRIALSFRFRRRLRIYRRRGAVARQAAMARFVLHRARHRLFGPRRNKAPAVGGALIAFVGPDATGKSTLLRETEKWLGQVYAVRSVHAGKPPSSWTTLPLNAILPLARRARPDLRRDRRSASSDAPTATDGGRRTSLLEAVRAVSLAWDRRRLLIRARRDTARGIVVLSDRYPSAVVGAMDSPRLGEESGAILRLLGHLEAKFYSQIPPPDAVVRLTVSLEVAKRRNRERSKSDKHSDEHLEERHVQSPPWSRPGVGLVRDVDTDGALAETLLEVKKAVWSWL